MELISIYETLCEKETHQQSIYDLFMPPTDFKRKYYVRPFFLYIITTHDYSISLLNFLVSNSFDDK